MKESHQITWGRAGVMAPVLLLLMLIIAPAGAVGVLGAKYMGSIPAGGTSTHEMTISLGAGEDPADIAVEANGFGQTLDAVYIPLGAASDTSPYSARKYISLDRTTLHLEPGSSQTVTATITFPQNVGEGGRYAIISVHALPGKGKAFSTAVNVRMFITIAGTPLTEAGSILSVDASAVTAGQPFAIVTTLKNTGNYHYYYTRNWITLKDASGATVANVTTSPLIYAIIPGNTIRFTVKPDIGTLQPGTYSVVSRVLLEGGQVLDEKTTTFEVTQPYVSPVTEASITLSPGSPGTLMSAGGRYSVTFPQGAVLSEVMVTIRPYPREQLHTAPAGAKLGVTCFEIVGLSGLLSKDATVRVAYSTDDLAVAGGDASLLKLAYWDTVGNAWVILPTQVNTQDMSLTTTTNHMSVWAVMVSSTTGAVPPGGTGKSFLPLGTGIIILGIVLGILLLVLRRRR